MSDQSRGGISRNLNAHKRLVLALLVACAAGLVLPLETPLAVRLAIAWDCGVVGFLLLTWWVIRNCPPEEMRKAVLANDQGRRAILGLVLLATLASLASIFFLLEKSKGANGVEAPQVALAVMTIVCSWVFTHVMFALHYAHRFYRDDPSTAELDATGGLTFPGNDAPDYWDFLYFSFVIGMTSQVSDVQVTSRPMRRLVLVHGVLSFAFYTFVLALSINIVGSLV